MALAGKDANVKLMSAAGTTSAAEAMSLIAGTSSAYAVTDKTKRHMDRDVAPVIYNNSTAVSSTAYTIQAVQGRITFASTASATPGPVTADLTYHTAATVAGGRQWSLNVQQDLFEISQFGSSGWKEYQSNMVGATAQIGRYWSDSDFFDYLNTDSAFIVELIPGSTADGRYEAYAYVSADNVDTPTDGIVGETIDLQIDGQVYYTTE